MLDDAAWLEAWARDCEHRAVESAAFCDGTDAEYRAQAARFRALARELPGLRALARAHDARQDPGGPPRDP